MKIARFITDGKAAFGRILDPQSPTHAQLLEGHPLTGLIPTQSTAKIDKLLAPIIPTDLLCIGLNYHAHARETNGDVPGHPMLFIKASNSLAHPHDPILLPSNTDQVDYEAELVVIIARDCKNVAKHQALDYVLGYTCGNDVSARDWQKDKNLNGGQFARGKSFDSFAPIGPWIVTPDEIPDPNALAIKCHINGQTLQSSSTRDMIFDVPTIIASLSTTMTLRAGAAIFTGTPEGVGTARKPPRYLQPGDVVDIDIQNIGILRNPVQNA
jgi:2-keto-4-pentenoate hydratase/2-oxohepta-3-ene-1,7-dioic acid hydratase in catechol pathway